MVVVVAVAMIGVLAFEGAFNTTIDYQMASNARNNMIAEFHMRSGANLGRMLIRLQTDVLDKNRQYIGDIQIADYTGLFMSAFGGSREEVDALAQLMGGISGREMQALGVSVGQFDLQITTEDGKINLNCANGSATTKENLQAQLRQLVFLQDEQTAAVACDGNEGIAFLDLGDFLSAGCHVVNLRGTN